METNNIEILLIEDNTTDIRLIKEFLKKISDFSYGLESYSRLTDGLNRLKTKDFDIILLDLKLPDSDIESTIEKVLKYISKIPIVVLTGFDDEEIALNSLQKGFQDYLVKGELNENILKRAILYGIERHKIESKKLKERESYVKLDDKDKMILNILQDNYKISYKDISEKVNLAASTIHNRVQNLLNEGIIKKIDTVIDPSKAGYDTIAIIHLFVNSSNLNDIVQNLNQFNEVQLVATSAGEHNLILKLIAPDEKSLWRFINEKIKSIEGIDPDIKVSSFIDIFKMTNKIYFTREK